MRLNKPHNLKIGSVFNGVGVGITILGFFGFSATSIYNFLNNTWTTNWWWVVIALSITFGALAIIFWGKKHSHTIVSFFLNLFAKMLSYKLKKWEIIYEYLSEVEMQYEAHFDVVALQTGVDHIRVRYNWSGATESNPIKPEPILDSGYQTTHLEPDGTEFGYSFFKVFSNTKINVGDRPIKLGVKISNLKETVKKASPHLLTNVNVPTEELIMKVLLPSNIFPEDIEFLEYIHATDDHHWHKYVQGDDHNIVRVNTIQENKKEIVWPVKHPIIGGKYVIRWQPRISK